MESGRISGILAQTRRCTAASALARARALQGSGACKGGPCAPRDSTIVTPVPQSSTNLSERVSNCYFVQGPEYGVPESIRLARQQQRSLDLATDPTNPSTRFSQFRRPYVPVFPPIPQWYYTAGEPVLQGPCKVGTDSAELAIASADNPNNTVPPA